MPRLPFIDRIWTARGFVELDPPRTPAEAFGRLDSLLQSSGTSYEVSGDTLTYSKDNPAAQDKLATFTRGTLQVVVDESQSRLRYTLGSPALLLCFLAPLMFLAFAQATIFITELEQPTAEEKAAAEKEKAEKEKEEKDPPPMNAVDKFLGAPQPETLEEKKKREEAEKKEDEDEGEHSPTPAYVFAGIFAALYLVGRMLEPWLVRRTFRSALNEPSGIENAMPADPAEAPRPG